MPRVISVPIYICNRCSRTQRLRGTNDAASRRVRLYASASPPQSQVPVAPKDGPEEQSGRKYSPQTAESGAMSRRLEELTNRAIEETGARSKQAFEEAGFSEELKRQLEERIEMGKFKSENAAAFAQVEMPVWSSLPYA